MSKLPVGKVCPSCGGTSYTKAYPERFIAFQKDRICCGCGTRYAPPTPRWAGLVFLLLGFMALQIVFVLIMAQSEGDPWLAARDMAGVVILMVVLGLLLTIHGIRVLIRPGKQ